MGMAAGRAGGNDEVMDLTEGASDAKDKDPVVARD
jgi:hypothetical protein